METQKIVLFGAETKAGERILKEALGRGHSVTAITPDPKKISISHPSLKVVAGDIRNKNDITQRIKGHHVVISAYESKMAPLEHVTNTNTLIGAVKGTDTRQLIVMGHPGNELEPTFSAPANAEGWKAVADAQRKVREALEDQRDFRWSYVHYPEIEETLDKNGKPLLSSKVLVKSPDSEQRVAIGETAQAVVDQVEHFTEAHTEL